MRTCRMSRSVAAMMMNAMLLPGMAVVLGLVWGNSPAVADLLVPKKQAQAAAFAPSNGSTPSTEHDADTGHREVVQDAYLPGTPQAFAVPPQWRTTWTVGPYTSVQVNVDEFGYNIPGDAANEPSIAVDPTDPGRLAIGWRQFDTTASDFRQAGWGYSSDGGHTWTFPGVLEPGIFRSDPVLDTDADGNFFYHSLSIDGGYQCKVFKSVDGGTSWNGGVYAFGGDKAWMAIDRTGGIGHGNIYAAWDYAGCCGDDWFNRSTDGSQTFESPVPIPEQPMWGVTAVGPDGEVYVAGRRRTTNSEFVVAKSTTVKDPAAPLGFDFAVDVDMGGSLLYYVFGSPNPAGLLGQVWIAVDHSDGPTRGYVYVLSSIRPTTGTDPLDIHFVRSTDGGLTWSSPVRINDDTPGDDTWQWFGTMSVAPNGRIDVVWNDTRNDPGGYDSELYYAWSEDAGETWAANVAVSPAFDPHLGWPQQNKLGDYYDMVSDDLGANLAYAATFNGEQDVYFLRIGTFDCNGNGIHDETDIAEGTSEDCDTNGVPDECELAGNDCNVNDVPDECDISAGTSEDADSNGIPDECEGCPYIYDLDGSCFVDAADLGLFAPCWLLSEGEAGWDENDCADKDFDCSGMVDASDLGLFAGAWLKSSDEFNPADYPECRTCGVGGIICP